MGSVSVIADGRKKSIRLKGGSKVLDVLKELGINREAVVCRLNNTVVPEDAKLKNNDKLEIIRIVSSG